MPGTVDAGSASRLCPCTPLAGFEDESPYLAMSVLHARCELLVKVPEHASLWRDSRRGAGAEVGDAIGPAARTR